jgi:hypothetical protein
MKRAFLRGCWNDAGIAIPDAQASELDNVVPMRRSEDYHQGRDCQNRVPRVSPMAGKPRRSEEDNALRAGFWSFYAAALLTAACVVILANWPN